MNELPRQVQARGGTRPVVTLVLLTYNQENFVSEAVRGALAQAYSPLEIIISDDDSQDNTFSIIQDIASPYAGPHNLIVRRNPVNLGLIAHLNVVMRMISSGLVVIAAGDDVSLPHRVQRLVEIWSEQDVTVICSNALIVDDKGRPHGLFGKPGSRWLSLAEMVRTGHSGVFGAALAWDRRVFEAFGPLSDRTRNEDGIISFRGTLLGRVRYTSEPLLYYRRHDENLSYWVKMSAASNTQWIDLQQANLQNRVFMYLEWIELLENRQRSTETRMEYASKISALRARVDLLSLEKRLLGEPFEARFRTIWRNASLIRGPVNAAKFLLIGTSPALYAFTRKQARSVAVRVRRMGFLLFGKRWEW